MTRAQKSPNVAQSGFLPELLGFDWQESRFGYVCGRFNVLHHHLAPTGYLHAASVVALADSACGFGCLESLPTGSTGFTTLELKANFIGTTRAGGVTCQVRLIHAGRTTQVWDAEVMNEATAKVMALFRCTQMILYPSTSAISGEEGRHAP